MKWETVKLESLCSVITKGTTPSNIGEAFTDSGINYIRSEMLTSSKFISGEFLHISEETHNKLKRSQLHANDILFSMAGVYLGKTAILRPEDVPANTNQAVALIRVDEAKAIPEYVYYTLNIPQIVKLVNTVQSQSAQPNINLKQIGNLDIPLPSIEKQLQVVDILAAYDSLIENNQKQIKLLEEAAQRLYKEWFIDFRFPGHESTPIHDGIPAGWEKSAVSDFGVMVTGKTPSTENADYFGGGIPFVKIPDMHQGVFPVVTETQLSSIGADSQKNKYIPKNSIMVSCIATVGLVNISVDSCQTNQQINSVILNDEHDLYYLYFALKDIKSILEGVGSNGATMTNVNKAKFSNLPIVKPTLFLRNKFYSVSKPLFDNILTLTIEDKKLIEARDRLLPKLMSGEIEV